METLSSRIGLLIDQQGAVLGLKLIQTTLSRTAPSESQQLRGYKKKYIFIAERYLLNKCANYKSSSIQPRIIHSPAVHHIS